MNMAQAQDVPIDLCRVCSGSSRWIFSKVVLGRPVDYFDCPTCGYFQTETPHWLEEAYTNAINDVDTGIMTRNAKNVGRVTMTLLSLSLLKGRVVDHAGGYGILVRMLRDAGIDAYWSDKYCKNLLAKGFEDENSSCDLVTAFEVFEHLTDPVADLRKMLEAAPVVLISTELILGTASPSDDWWYLAPEHGQHIGFFRQATLAWMASKIGCHYASDGRTVHLFSHAPIPRSWRLFMRWQGRWKFFVSRRLISKTNEDFTFLRQHRG